MTEIEVRPNAPIGATDRLIDRSKWTHALDRATHEGATYAEIRLMSETTTSVVMRDGQLERAVPGRQVAGTLRVLVDGAWGVHSSTDLRSLPDAVGSAMDLARAVARRRPSGAGAIQLADVPVRTDSIHWVPERDVREADLEERLELMEAFDAAASDDERVVSVSTGWSDEHLHTELLTSEGMDRSWSFQRTLMHGMVTARTDGDPASYRTRVGGEGGMERVREADVQGMGEQARIAALRILDANRAPSGRMTLVSDPDLTGVYIHEALGHPCEADLVASGDSCLEGRLGTMVGSSLVSVVDDPTIRSGYGAYPIDDEGVAPRRKELITNGRLTEYLNHRESAGHLGLDPNGGARAQDGLHHPLVRMSNTLLLGGTHTDLDELVEDIDDGVYACGSRGGQVDTGRGSFQFAAQEAWLIEDGRLTTPLKDVSVSGLTLQILQDVDGMTRDADLASPGFCGKGQTVPVGDGGPTMRIRSALVG